MRAILVAILVLVASLGFVSSAGDTLNSPGPETTHDIAVPRYNLQRTGVAADAFNIHFWKSDWTFQTNGTAATAAIATDVDGDGVLELVFGEMREDGANKESRQGYVVDRQGNLRYSVKMHDDSYAAGAVDLDGDGHPELIFAEGSSIGTRFRVFHGYDGSPFWNVTIAFRSGDVIASPALVDVDGDGLLDLIASSTDGAVYAFHGTNGSVIWSTPLGEEISTSAVPTGDIEGDGRIEVVVETLSGVVHVLDAMTGAERWSLATGPGPLQTLGLADLDGDGGLETVVAHCSGDGLFAIRPNGTIMWHKASLSSCNHAPALLDVSGDALPDVIAYDSLQGLVAVGGTNGTVLWSNTAFYSVGLQPIVAAIMDSGNMYILKPWDLEPSTARMILYYAGGGSSQWLIYITGGRFFQGEFLVRDLDGDGLAELAMAVGDGRLYLISCEGSAPNNPPVADAGGPYSALEGSPIMFNASGSTDPDGDNLTFRWDFTDDGTFDTPWSSSPFASFTFGDDFVGKARVEVSDGQLIDNATANVTVSNVAPTIGMTIIPTGNEGDTLIFQAHATDPGSDDLTFTWGGSCTGWSAPRIYYNNGVSPDPYPSPDIHPRDVWDNQTVVCGDNAQYEWSVSIRDDDGGIARARGTFTIDNLPPELTVSPPKVSSIDEGSIISFNATARDSGSDDLTFEWAWEFGQTDTAIFYNNGVSPDPADSPNGTFPFSANSSSSFIYGHEGNSSMTLTVTDDDGGYITYTTEIDVLNVAPTAQAGPDVTIDEGSPASVNFVFSDPGFDMPQAGLYENFTASVDWGYAAWPPESVPVDKIAGGPGVPTTGSVNLSKAYGDNGVFTVTLTLCDDGGGCGTASLVVTVNNVAPTLVDLQAYVVANVTLRVAGEKWHDVQMDLVWDGNVTGTARVDRMPGSPDLQTGTVEGAHLQLLGSFAIVLHYTPDDDEVNGQTNGGNPAWVILTFPDGSEVRLHHTFNVRHPATWVWTIDDLRPYLVGKTITFQATAHDVGSDDLTFTWSFGDGSPDASAIYYNDGIGPDPYPSPEVNPITITYVHTHAYVAAGMYTVKLTVRDDDGETATEVFLMAAGA